MIWNAFLIALRQIRRNVMRAFPTVLGVIIGVSAVVTMVTLGQATTDAVKQQVSSLGSNLLMVNPGQSFGHRASSAGVPLFTNEDVVVIARQVAGVALAAPVSNTSLGTIYLQNARSSMVTGTTGAYFAVHQWKLERGRFFTEQESQSGRGVCVIGHTVRQELFGSVDPVGQKLRVRKASLEVVGGLAC